MIKPIVQKLHVLYLSFIKENDGIFLSKMKFPLPKGNKICSFIVKNFEHQTYPN